ncbi:MAG: RNA 2',3'-cyclic phosphodiesterase [Parcubacteria group bacterium CG11_big_fil_rev_8_21_14_0_20_39_14]|nr:MAG: RNA 2',3'-cyclic phosphodiesterase [Parcubacteria group bacterium CG11_big_fil_rev_8_21_14_0_20_39_14]PIS35143.1 MAG: RNA 2',3'-cyclic phosphodiesterase [Parcubacteria group bacterium CG08_land_8_20_14_0_20_38_56]
MSHRIFIAINFPEDTKRKLVEIQQKWAKLPVHWTKKASLHFTLVFLGYMDDGGIWEVCKITKKVASLHQPFFINFKKVLLGPPNRPPRMIWVEGEKSAELAKLKQDLENFLSSGKSIDYQPESRAFSPHLTLARIRTSEWRSLQSPPKIEENVSLSFAVNSIEVMESRLLRDGAEYTVLESAELG